MSISGNVRASTRPERKAKTGQKFSRRIPHISSCYLAGVVLQMNTEISLLSNLAYHSRVLN